MIIIFSVIIGLSAAYIFHNVGKSNFIYVIKRKRITLLHFDLMRKRRRREIVKVLPHVLDALTLSIEAGLDFMMALDRIAFRWEDSVLIRELKVLIKDVKTGQLRSRALKNLATRLQVAPVNSLVSLLVQADRLGISIGQVLRAEAKRLRAERFQNADRKGREAALKLLFPLVFCIMPVVFIVVFGPLFVRWLTGGFNWMF